MEAGVHKAVAHSSRQRAQRSPWEHAAEAIRRLNVAMGAMETGDVPLAQDKLDEAYASVIAARRATGPDHHHRDQPGVG